MTASSSSCRERAVSLSGCPDPGPRPTERGGNLMKGPPPLLGGQRRALEPGPRTGPSPPQGPNSQLGTEAGTTDPPRPPSALRLCCRPARDPNSHAIPPMGLCQCFPLSFPRGPGHGQVSQSCVCPDHDNEVSRKDALPPFQKWGSVETQRRRITCPRSHS